MPSEKTYVDDDAPTVYDLRLYRCTGGCNREFFLPPGQPDWISCPADTTLHCPYCKEPARPVN
jgi:hypothetical protein